MSARRRALKPCGETRERRLPTNASLPEATHDIYARVNCDMSSGGGVLGFLKRLRYRMHNVTGLYMLNKFERWCLYTIFALFFYSIFLILKHWFYPSHSTIALNGDTHSHQGQTRTLLSGFGGVWLEDEHWKDLLDRIRGP